MPVVPVWTAVVEHAPPVHGREVFGPTPASVAHGRPGNPTRDHASPLRAAWTTATAISRVDVRREFARTSEGPHHPRTESRWDVVGGWAKSLLRFFGLGSAAEQTKAPRKPPPAAAAAPTKAAPAKPAPAMSTAEDETSFSGVLGEPGGTPAKNAGGDSGKNARAPGPDSGKNARAPGKVEKPWQPAKPEFNEGERHRILACNEDEVQALAATITSTLLASLDKIPPFPVVASKLVQTLEGDDVRADVVERLITQDAVIAARILSTANSSFYSPPSTIETLPHAIRVIGLQEVARIAVAVAASAVFDVEERIAHESVAQQQQKVWAHSLATARGTSWLAMQLNQDVQRAYVVGLLHDIGKPVALRGLGMALVSGRLPSQPSAPLVAAAIEACHVDVGAMVADAWQLAPHLTAVIAGHHAEALDNPLLQMVALVSAVDELRTNPAHRNGLLLLAQSLARDLQVAPMRLAELEFELKKAAALSRS
jgi:putative nucleotidyltransferase with HDIG domain